MPRKKPDVEEEIFRFSLRLPIPLHKAIKKRADKSRRSINQEIIWLLWGAIHILQKDPAYFFEVYEKEHSVDGE